MPCTISSPDPDEESVMVEAGRLLGRLIRREAHDSPLVTIPPKGFVQRESTSIRVADDPDIAAALAIMHEQFSQGINIADVVNHLSISSATFSRSFKPAVGMLPSEYLARLRVEHAKKLLTGTTGLTLEKIASMCGFRDRERFNIVFERITGTSPKSFRSQAEASTD